MEVLFLFFGGALILTTAIHCLRMGVVLRSTLLGDFIIEYAYTNYDDSDFIRQYNFMGSSLYCGPSLTKMSLCST